MHREWTWLSIIVLALVSFTARADEVTLPFKGLTLGAEMRLPAEKGPGDVPFFLITHGTLAHGRMEIIQGLQEQLTGQGYGTLAITLGLGMDRRTGMYDCAAPQNHRHTDAVEEIGAWLDWLKAQGVKQVVLLGHSRGGNQTAWFAAEHDDPVISKVVLMAPMTWSAKGSIDAYRREHKNDLRSVFARARKMVTKSQGETPIKGVGFLHCPGATVTAATFVDYYRNDPRFDTPALIKSINKPVLVVVGTHDQFVPDLAKRAQPLADGARVQLRIVDGADHFFRDFYLDEAAEGIGAFVDSAGQ